MKNENGLEFCLSTEAETIAFGRDLGRALQAAAGLPCILMYGELGSGKTTLTRGIVAVFPGGDDAEVSSPSFTLSNVYPTFPPIVHCDLYRSGFGSFPDEIAEVLDEEKSLVLVEWAERIAEADLPPARMDIRFCTCNKQRIVALVPKGEAAYSVLRELAGIRGISENALPYMKE